MPVETIPKCQVVLTARRKQLEYHRLMQLTWLDQYYYDNKHKVQKLGFRFAEALDPTILVQSLSLAIDQHPVIGSKVIQNDGKSKFHFDAESVQVRLLHVEPQMLREMQQLEQLCEIFCKPNADQKLNQLFSAFLFKTSDPKDGSVLICGFQHCVGDAMSYGLFMSTWSKVYEQLRSTTTQEPDLELPPEIFTQYNLLFARPNRAKDGPLYRHFSFSDQALRAIKDDVLSACKDLKEGERLTTNDILCAQCAIAVAPARFEQQEERSEDSQVRVFVLVDTRGRSKVGGHAVGEWGNYVSDIVVDFCWKELLDLSPGNVVRVAQKIRRTLLAQLPSLSNLAEHNESRANRARIPKLFCWNSWARVGDTLRTAQFSSQPSSSTDRPSAEGKNLQELTWFNASWFPDVDTVVVEPRACLDAEGGSERLVVHVASPTGTAELDGENLLRFWSAARVSAD